MYVILCYGNQSTYRISLWWEAVEAIYECVKLHERKKSRTDGVTILIYALTILGISHEIICFTWTNIDRFLKIYLSYNSAQWQRHMPYTIIFRIEDVISWIMFGGEMKYSAASQHITSRTRAELMAFVPLNTRGTTFRTTLNVRVNLRMF